MYIHDVLSERASAKSRNMVGQSDDTPGFYGRIITVNNYVDADFFNLLPREV